MDNNQNTISKLIFTVTFVLGTFLAHAFIAPVIKRQIDVTINIDTTSKTSSETRIYSYRMIDKNGSYGTYTEKRVFNAFGRILSMTQTKRNIPFLGCKTAHTIISQRIEYNADGKIANVHRVRKASAGNILYKDIAITYLSMIKRSRKNYLKQNNHLIGYQKPNIFQVRAHRLKK